MKKRNILLLVAAAGAAYWLLKRQTQSEVPAASATVTPELASEPVVHVIEETLHQHEGEDNPIVHAFEEALEEKAKHA